MKKVSVLIIALLVFPAMLLAQYRVKAIHQEPVNLKVDIKGYNDRLPAASMNVTFLFDQETETLSVTMNQGLTKCDFNKIWLPQHDVTVSDMGKYMKARGVKLKKAQTFVDQENFLNLSNRTLAASILTTNMNFNGVYDLKSKKKVKKQLDHQMVPLDGTMELCLSFKTNPKAKTATLILKNPIPMNRKGSKGTVGYVAEDVVITIDLGRCKNAEQLITTIEEYEALFQVAENKVNELKSRPQEQKAYRNFILQEYAVIDTNRFIEATCDEVQEHWQNLSNCIKRIKKQKSSTNIIVDECDVAKLNKEIKDVTTKLNNLVNDWSLASDAGTKAEKKATFDAAVQKFDGKLNDLPSGCKAKLDAKLLKNYEFVKKLIK